MTIFQNQQVLKDRYRIDASLTPGGFGLTYRAYDLKNNQPVAIKTLNRNLHGDRPNWEEMQDKFVNEAMVLATLQHPHIVKVYPQMFRVGDLWCMVMEYVDGADLLKPLREGQVFSESQALKIMGQVGAALHHMHTSQDQPILHRDVKPNNILLRKQDQSAVLIDFGLAREVDIGAINSITNSLTEGFAPPEQYKRRDSFTPALDIYALAATLYTLLTGQMMPPGKYRGEFNIPVTPAKQINPSVSARTNEAIITGTAVQAADRPPSMLAWLELLGMVSRPVVNVPPTVPAQFRRSLINTPQVQTPDIGHQISLPQSFVEDLGSGIKLEMVLIPAGSFMMGTPDDEIARLCKEYGSDWFKCESPQHRVEIKEPFYLGKFLVTQGQWQAVMGSNPSHFKNGNNCPVDSVSWNDCQEFIKKINKKTGKTYRLPSEAEWEYSCRAGSSTKYCFGNNENSLGEYAWYSQNSGSKTHPVGEKKPNKFGLYDMHGNLWEWCEDDWEDNYKKGRIQKPYKNTTNILRVLRGGSWVDVPGGCRSANRSRDVADGSDVSRGFRVVCVGSSSP